MSVAATQVARKISKTIKVKPSWINSLFSSNPDAVWRD
jgi:hypothetical protein